MSDMYVHTMRETKLDKKKERVILNRLAKHFGVNVQQVLTLGKYKIDGILHSGGIVHSYVECKWLSKEGFYGVNTPKYVEGCQLAAWSKVPFIYGLRVPGKIGYIVVHDGNWTPGDDKSRHTGGVKNPPNWDDIEPMMMLDPSRVEWVEIKK